MTLNREFYRICFGSILVYVVICQNNEVRFVGSLIHCLILNILKIIVLNCQKCGVPAWLCGARCREGMRGSQAWQCHSAGELAVPRRRGGQRCESYWRKGELQNISMLYSTSSLQNTECTSSPLVESYIAYLVFVLTILILVKKKNKP